MKVGLLASMRGAVRVVVRGGRIEAMINEAAARGMTIWNVKSVSGGVTELDIVLGDFFRLRPLLKQTGCRVHVKDRHGLPFLLDKLGRRIGFAVGLALFLAGLFVLSSLVWDVQVEGDNRIPREDILSAARQAGIYPLQWKGRLAEPDQLSGRLERLLPDASWVGVEISGTQVRIKIVEARKPDLEELQSPRNLIAKSDAVVTDLYVEKGKPMVAPNERVRKGDILVSGIIGDESNSETVVAKGKVRGLVWHEYDVQVPMHRKWKTYTGESYPESVLEIGKWAVRIGGWNKPTFAKSEAMITGVKTWKWRGVELPVRWMRQKVMEVRYLDHPLTAEEAIKTGLEQAKADVLRKNGLDAKVKAEQILKQSESNGVMSLRVLIESDEVISAEQPLVSGPSSNGANP